MPTQPRAETPHPPNPLVPPFRNAMRSWRFITFVYVPDGGLGEDRLGETWADPDNPQDGAFVFIDDACTDGEYAATLGHEIGHLLWPEITDEAEIDARAAAMLIPAQAVSPDHTREDIARVATRWGVDPKLVRARIRSSEHQVPDASGGDLPREAS